MPPNDQNEQNGTVQIEQNTSFYVTEPDDEGEDPDDENNDTSPNQPNSE
jgi:hypothetical protein